ncbi:hypothetical protein [Thermoflexibacter ruber]|uniref:Lipoprotein n=1 Tax=Thermoflexibacter ruber TaxID=1003 RepID=A0A1I2K0T1_9BACT|nr:hypothetical protein [Thermoflexibacter ruber]SFF60454.1 hypothetical protein SAMN04488541_10789 [Thermoflexibacter ruber]
MIQKTAIFIICIFICGCSVKNSILKQINDTFYSQEYKMYLGGDFGLKSRKDLMRRLDKQLFLKHDTIVIFQGIHYGSVTSFGCDVYDDTVRYMYHSMDIKTHKTNFFSIPFPFPYNIKNSRDSYIFEKLKKGKLQEILEEAKNSKLTLSPPTSINLLLIIREGKKFRVENYEIKDFIPKPLQRNREKRQGKNFP